MTEQTMEPLAKHTTFRIGGPADYYLIPESRHEVSRIVCQGEKTAILYIRKGK